MACAFTHDLGSMIVMRGLQGFAGGILIPMAFTMVLTRLPKAQQPIGLAIFAVSVTFAPAIGPTIGGYLTETAGRRFSSSTRRPASSWLPPSSSRSSERRCSCVC
jgi:MFS transporter, DHA2 family, multidrug resistance protein